MRAATLFLSGLASLAWFAGGCGSTTPGARGSDANDSAVVVDTSTLEASRQSCVDRVNQLRATLGLKQLQRWTANESCADGQAQSDNQSGAAHGAFNACPNKAQNECPGWDSIASTLTGCIDQMWAEGPGTAYADHGHYINMTNSSYTEIACGFYVASNGKVWMVIDFR